MMQMRHGSADQQHLTYLQVDAIALTNQRNLGLVPACHLPVSMSSVADRTDMLSMDARLRC